MLTFPSQFRWGTATAAYQIEGAVREDGRGESIWDRFTHTPGKITNGDTGDVTCDHYHHWGRDVELQKELGLNAYRLSIAWPRIVPEGKGRINSLGIDFYSRLVDALLAAGIEPAVTLYHWDLPQALQEKGGWVNRDTAGYFTDFAFTVFNALSDRVPKWFTFNEPWVSAHMGYGFGEHAPGVADPRSALAAAHVINLAHAHVINLFRDDFDRTGEIGITLNLVPMTPETDEDADAAEVADGFMNRWFLDPALRGTYPKDMVDLFTAEGIMPEIPEGDMDLIGGASVDFIGVNYYMRYSIRRGGGPLGYQMVVTPGEKLTEMGWEVYPRGLYEFLIRLHEEYNKPVLYVTENGIACRDAHTENGVVQDDDRIEFIRDHLVQIWRAVDAGADVRGYYLWSLLDNFEWAHGFRMRFGIVKTDYGTLERIIKKSGHWYGQVARSGEVDEA